MELPEKKTLQHNELIKSIFAVYNPEDKAKYTSLFLSGFSTNKPVWRSGLAPKKEDFRIFSEIINILLEARPGDTVKKTIQSGIGKIQGFKSNTEQRQTWKHQAPLQRLSHRYNMILLHFPVRLNSG